MLAGMDLGISNARTIIAIYRFVSFRWGLVFRSGVGVLLTALILPPVLARIFKNCAQRVLWQKLIRLNTSRNQ
jgi:hypothetical protein